MDSLNVTKEKALELDKIRGCLFGGALGDALGYPVEFRTAEQIFSAYGENGIQDYELFHGKAYISDRGHYHMERNAWKRSVLRI